MPFVGMCKYGFVSVAHNAHATHVKFEQVVNHGDAHDCRGGLFRNLGHVKHWFHSIKRRLGLSCGNNNATCVNTEWLCARRAHTCGNTHAPFVNAEWAHTSRHHRSKEIVPAWGGGSSHS